jgi:hypothetical protein
MRFFHFSALQAPMMWQSPSLPNGTTTRTKHDMKKSDQRKQELRHKIMSQIQAVGIEVTGDFWFALIFRSESEMKKIAKQLGCR